MSSVTNKMRPIHPGEILRDEMEELGLSARALARALRVPVNRVTGILNGQRAVSAETALRLAHFLAAAPNSGSTYRALMNCAACSAKRANKFCATFSRAAPHNRESYPFAHDLIMFESRGC